MRQYQFASALCTIVTIALLPLCGLADGRHKDKKGRLRVVVTSKETSARVGAAVVIVRVKNEPFDETTSTDAQGVACMARVPHGTLVVQVVKSGLKTWGGEVEFKEDKTIQVTLEKEESTIPLQARRLRQVFLWEHRSKAGKLSRAAKCFFTRPRSLREVHLPQNA